MSAKIGQPAYLISDLRLLQGTYNTQLNATQWRLKLSADVSVKVSVTVSRHQIGLF